HIQVDLLTGRLAGRALKPIRVLWMAFVVAFGTALLLSAWRAATFSYDFGMYSEGYLEMPMWMPQSLLIVGSALLLLAAVAKVAWALRGGPSTEDSRI
ncbi:MAG: TRAP transporter small permease, partial [Pirellulales bacterium]|nr:TRAP transporter small permease [Pirellulales bacterium]